LAAARAELKSRHLGISVSARRYVKNVPAGQIASQTPVPGSRIAQGSTIAVVLSEGPPFVSVPPVAGLSEAAAAAQLGAHGLNPKPEAVYSLNVPVGEVISSSPTSGARWGEQITLEISQGPQPETIPGTLAGEDPTSATTQLQALGLKVSTTQQNSSTVPQGKVIGTDPALGGQAPQGSTVTLIISKGPVMVKVPNVSGDSVTQATNALSSAGLNPLNVYGPPGGTVFATDPAEGTQQPEGTSVSIYTAPH